MSQQELLKRVVKTLEESNVDYMLTGSLVSSLQGDPRSTHDIDLVVTLTSANVPSLLQAFPLPRFYLDQVSIAQAISHRQMFNLLDADTGDKVDFWLLTNDEFDQSRFARRQLVNLGDFAVNVSQPEDTILQKLKWAHDSGGSERQMQDARSVYEIQFRSLDHLYLERWAQKLRVAELLAAIKNPP
jgi:hypothetical protein